MIMLNIFYILLTMLKEQTYKFIILRKKQQQLRLNNYASLYNSETFHKK